MAVKIAICDDEVQFADQLETMVRELSKELQVTIDTEVYKDGSELLEYIGQGERFNLIFLDVEMKPMDGLTAAREIRKTDQQVLIIYVSSHEHYMQESFEVGPFRYLVKPVDKAMLEKYLKCAYNDIEGDRDDRSEIYHIKIGKVTYKLNLKEVLYFMSDKRKIIIRTTKEDGDITIYKQLNEVEKELKQSRDTFIRLQRSYLVNYRYVKKLSPSTALMTNGDEITISEDRRKEVSEIYCEIGGRW